MRYSGIPLEFLVKIRQEELLLAAELERRARHASRHAPPRQRQPRLARLRRGWRAFGLRHHARRRRLAQRSYTTTDWRSDVRAICDGIDD